MTALAILLYLAAVDRSGERIWRYAGPVLAVMLISACAAFVAWGRTDPLAILIGLHLPFAAWSAIGIGLCVGRRDHLDQGYAFLVKSMETVLTGGIYFGAGVVFLGLTSGIFAVLGVKLPQYVLFTVAAWGIGAVPIVAVASVYDPKVSPAAQSTTTGLARILRIGTRFLLPLALGVLAIYVLWFIPAYFWRPFQEREVLIIYNATIFAILVLLAIVVAGPDEQRSQRNDNVFRWAVLSLAILTLLLNAYALAAILSRTVDYGLSPNRYAFLGWNVVTLVILGGVVAALFRNRSGQWVCVLRESLTRLSVLAAGWALWVLLALPLSFR